MPNYLNFNNLSNYGVGYTDNLYNQSSCVPSFPSLFNNSNFYPQMNNPFTAYNRMLPPQNESPVASMTSNLKNMMMLMLALKQLELASNYSEISNDREPLDDVDIYDVDDIDESDYPTTEDNEQPVSYDVSKLKNKWRKYDMSDKFYSKVIDISKKVKCNPNDLMAIMKNESGFKADIQNSIGATGLIQFMPKTAKGLGTTTDKLKKMSKEEQLKYVEKYFVNNKKAAGFNKNEKIDGGTLYALTYLPAYAKKEVLARRGHPHYDQNKSLDVNKDGVITKTDLSKKVKQMREA